MKAEIKDLLEEAEQINRKATLVQGALRTLFNYDVHEMRG